MRERFLCAAAVLVFGLLLLPAAATASSNTAPGAGLDPTFGTAGVVTLPAELPAVASGMATQNGDILVSSGTGVQVLDDVGAAGEAFGVVGSMMVPAAPGDELLVSDLVIDPQGRLLVVGETRFPEAENPNPAVGNGTRVFRPDVVRILRDLPDGQLDPSFGQGGVVETDLGLPAPLGTDGKRLGTHPVIEPSGVEVDPRGRIVLTGKALVRLDEACRGRAQTAPVTISAGFVARLAEGGALDPSFGTGGLVGGRSLGTTPLGAAGFGDPVIGANGTITVRSTGAYTCGTSQSHLGITRLSPEGQVDRSFGKHGAMLGPYSALVGSPKGSVIALATLPRRRPEKEDLKARLIRVTANGKRDSSFGKGGRTTLMLGPGYRTTLDLLAIDSRGRILVGGTIGMSKMNSLALLRVSAGGNWERSLGPHGRVTTRAPRLAEYGGANLFFDSQGRLLTDRLFSGPRSGLLVARYLEH